MTSSCLRICLISLLFYACSVNRHSLSITDAHHLKYLNEYVVPYNFRFQKTTVGGLSGIDYDRRSQEYYLISDDRSNINPARFYKAQIVLKGFSIDSVIFKNCVFFKMPDGQMYPNSRKDPFHTPDPEALRLDPGTNKLVWSSEGERIVDPSRIVLENPAVTEIDTAGNYIDTFTLPAQLRMSEAPTGPRQNSVFEGLAFTQHFQSLLVSVEEPLLQDGIASGSGDTSGITRILKFDVSSRKPLAQYAYRLDPVARPPVPAGSFRINGISDIMSLDDNHLLVIERSFSTGHLACTIKVYLADLTGADNIEALNSMAGKSDIKQIRKTLLLNMDDLGIYIDNIEGVTFGPVLPDGNKSLLFIADNNFNPMEKTQLLLFEWQ